MLVVAVSACEVAKPYKCRTMTSTGRFRCISGLEKIFGASFSLKLQASNTARKFPFESVPIFYNETMRAFQIVLNGKRICVAGIPRDCVLSTTITYVPIRKRKETRLYVGGLEVGKNEHVFWEEATLRAGDEVRIKIVETKSVDAPLRRYLREPAGRSRSRKASCPKTC